MDLVENCRLFLDKLVAKKSLDFASIWLNSAHLPKSSVNTGAKHICVRPSFRLDETQIPDDHIIFQKLTQNSRFICSEKDEDFEALIAEKNIKGGHYAVCALDDGLGFIKLYTSREQNFTAVEINVLASIVKKLSVSINACLFHEKSILEAEERLNYQHSLREKDELYRLVVSSINEGLVISDKEGRIIYANERMVELSGYQLEEMKGKRTAELFLSSDFMIEAKGAFSARSEGNVYIYEMPYQHKTEGTWWAEVKEGPYKDLEGNSIGTIGVITSIDERMKANKARLDSERRLGLIVDTALDAVVTINHEGYVIEWNKQAEHIFGWTSEEAIGEEMGFLIIPHQYRDAHKKGMENYFITGHGPVLNNRIEITALRKNGEEFPIELAITPIETTESATFCGFIRDISERKRAEQDLIEARQRAEASSIAKERFLANMSHEIRTPLNAIMGLSDLLANSIVDEKQNKYLKAITQSGQNLLVILNDILDLSKIDSGKLELEQVGFSMRQRLEYLMQMLVPPANDKGVELRYDCPDNIADVLVGDPVRLDQVLINLVNNAIKFTEEGYVNLSCRILTRSKTEQTIEFEVSDTGIGINADKIEQIFDSFTQADESITRRFGGTGLGLSICKKLVELMGGTIRVKSRVGLGTTFTFILPFGIGSEADLPNLQEEHQDFDLSKVRVLLVEDHEMNRFLAMTILEEKGMEVTHASNGKEAVDLIQKHNFDIVLMDVQMPIMSGTEATRVIREQLKMDIPIIALTANAVKNDAEKYLASGMDAYVSKPFNAKHLFGQMARLLHILPNHQHQAKQDPASIKGDIGKPSKALDEASTENKLAAQEQHQQTEANTDSSEVKPPPACLAARKALGEAHHPTYNLSKLKEMASDSPPFLKRMLEMFVERTPGMTEEVHAHILKEEWTEAGAIAHKLKPSFDMLGIDSLTSLARNIEQSVKSGEHLDHLHKLSEQLQKSSVLVVEDLRKELAQL